MNPVQTTQLNNDANRAALPFACIVIVTLLFQAQQVKASSVAAPVENAPAPAQEEPVVTAISYGELSIHHPNDERSLDERSLDERSLDERSLVFVVITSKTANKETDAPLPVIDFKELSTLEIDNSLVSDYSPLRHPDACTLGLQVSMTF